jgi:membrane-associated protease RseP (regulator of RpoE activity)
MVPFFKVDRARPGGESTLYAIRNTSTSTTHRVVVSYWVDWPFDPQADPDRTQTFDLAPRQVRTVNLRDVSGLAVTELAPGSPAASAGLRPGDIIASINRKPVDSIETAKRLAERSRDGLLLNIRRGDQGLFMVLR